MKQLHGKCISCDRPLNVVRQEHKLGELPMHASSIATTSRPHGPGWEALSNRTRGCGEAEVAPKLRCGLAFIGRATLLQEGTQQCGDHRWLLCRRGVSPPSRKHPDEDLIKAARPATCRSLNTRISSGPERSSCAYGERSLNSTRAYDAICALVPI